MRIRDVLKWRHEKAIADQLLDALQIAAARAEQGDAERSEPDVLYALDRRRVGIEVATVYYSGDEAEEDWTAAAGETPSRSERSARTASVIGSPDETIRERTQKEIDDKCGKRYEGADEYWLCIEQRAALSDAESVERCIETLSIPARHQFTKIYLTYLAPVHEGGRYTARQIVPGA